MTRMSPEFPLHPESVDRIVDDWSADEPLDAEVYDVHPALAPPPDYPYAYQADQPFRVRNRDAGPSPLLRLDWLEAPADYVVPPRFGMSAIVGMTTALAVLFGVMHWMSTEPHWYLFYGMQSIVICLVQMFHGKSPRKASAIAGAVMGPLFVLGTAWFGSGRQIHAAEVLCFTIMMVPCGAFLGYLNGTCAAGIFLVMDKLEQYFKAARDPTQP